MRIYRLDDHADDEDDGARGRAADGGAHLEQHDREQEDALDGEEAVQLAEHQLEGALGEQVGAAVPADVV